MRFKHGVSVIAILTLILAFQPVSSVSALSGIVHDQDGTPIVGAQVMFIMGTRYLDSTASALDGVFSIDGEYESGNLIVFHDDPDTPGVDYIPYLEEVADGEAELDITLLPASSIVIEGSLMYVDTENLALHANYVVMGIGNETLTPAGIPLIYGSFSNEMNLLELPKGHIVVPSGSTVKVAVNSTFLLGSNVISRSFTTRETLTMPRGGVEVLDVREYSLPLNFRITSDAEIALDGMLEEMNGYGFYLTKQEGAYSAASRQVSEAKTLYEEGQYTESFDSLKKGYITLDHTLGELDGMYRDASLSVYILITFLAAASLVTGYLLADGVTRHAVDAVLSAGSLTTLYLFYPGSRIIAFRGFVSVCVAAIIVLSLLGNIFPRFFSVGSGGRVHTRNLIIPVFSIAKRSLRRRKLRFILTLVSITLLVTSFVTLTSFSEGYGIIEDTYSKKGEWEGVSIRDGSWSRSDPTFILLSEAEMDWLTSNPEMEYLSPKAENDPQRRPYIWILGEPVMGVVGVDSYEGETVNIGGILLQGDLPDENGVLVPSGVAEQNDLRIGDVISVSILELEVQGIFSEDALNGLKDLDGAGYAPDKWVNVSPEGEAPNWVIQDCEGSEVVIMNTETAIGLPRVGIQRIAMGLREGVGVEGFAERLALERGYRAYASTPDDYVTFRLGNYFEGRGLSLIIPWAIVVLNVVITMLNSLYERRGEIEILSSVGLNPAQVSAIFVAEAFITGFMAGGMGYLIGLGIYRGMAYLNIGLQVHQKVSAVWSIASITLAVSAVLTGAYAALRNSVVITPSLMRRWKIDRDSGGFHEPYRIAIPLKLEAEEIDPYIEFIHRKLKGMENHPTQVTSSIKVDGAGEGKRIRFIYKSAQAMVGNFYTRNELKITRLPNGEYGATLESLGDPNWVHVAGSLIRSMTMEYSTEDRG
ncbi:MAG TPA: FtsX-like permease family protein [Candidatus Krumholzibacteriaceae bacterium]|nr:FtsX-like permease family protein [Candidatus Krumholzibacteriaceae bacterium]